MFMDIATTLSVMTLIYGHCVIVVGEADASVDELAFTGVEHVVKACYLSHYIDFKLCGIK